MTRVFVTAMVFLGCQQQAPSSLARLTGTHGLALHGEVLAVTSADTNELRVLHVNPPNYASSGVRLFVTGPNPLETLSIPTLDRPTIVSSSHAARFGVGPSGQLLFAGRPGAAELSVVHADPSNVKIGLVEVRRVPLPGPTTALVAGAPSETEERVYVATTDGARGVLLEVVLTPPALGARVARTRVLRAVADEVFSALAVVAPLTGRTDGSAPFCDRSACLAVGTRRGAGTQGDSFLVDPTSGAVRPLPFQGPVRSLVSHGAYASMAAGRFVHALLDEEACGGPDCGGVVAIDTSAPNWSQSRRLTSALKGLPMSISVGPGPLVGVDQTTTALVGALGLGNGRVLFFDAETQLPLTVGGAEYVVALDSTVDRCSGGLVPGASVWDTNPVGGASARLFLAFPSANFVSELRPLEAGFRPAFVGETGVLNRSNGLICYR
jgi:hypothetical protein